MYPRIRSLRKDAEMTQAQIAKLIQCSQRVYSNYELGKLDIPTEILIWLANFHNVSTDYLLGISDVKNPEDNSGEKSEYRLLMFGLADRLRAAREKSGFSQNEVSQRVDIPARILWEYENGTKLPSAQVLITLSEFYNCSIDHLLGKPDCSPGIIDAAGLSRTQINIINQIINEFKNKTGQA